MATALSPAPEEACDSQPPIGHYAHPLDPSKRTALCGVAIIGTPAFGEFEKCLACRIAHAAGDWAPLWDASTETPETTKPPPEGRGLSVDSVV